MSRDMSLSNITNPGKHKAWLDNEYAQWVKALGECTVHNFKEHPGVRRMLGEPDINLWGPAVDSAFGEHKKEWDLLFKIDKIGGDITTGRLFRYIYYAQQILKINPSSICEIGGGVGQFYAVLRALGWKGEYWIEDLAEVKDFQYNYLVEVEKQTGLDTYQHPVEYNTQMLISFYALGEFDDETKEHYRTLIDRSTHGYIAWNVHSGASDDKDIFSSHNITITPGVEPGIEIIQW